MIHRRERRERREKRKNRLGQANPSAITPRVLPNPSLLFFSALSAFSAVNNPGYASYRCNWGVRSSVMAQATASTPSPTPPADTPAVGSALRLVLFGMPAAG